MIRLVKSYSHPFFHRYHDTSSFTTHLHWGRESGRGTDTQGLLELDWSISCTHTHTHTNTRTHTHTCLCLCTRNHSDLCSVMPCWPHVFHFLRSRKCLPIQEVSWPERKPPRSTRRERELQWTHSMNRTWNKDAWIVQKNAQRCMNRTWNNMSKKKYVCVCVWGGV